jgi:hypothetical protein
MLISRYQEAREATLESYDAVNRRMGIEDNPPDGLLSHAVAPMEGGGVRFWEVWESEDDMHRFEEQRLIPAMREKFGDEMSGEEPQAQLAELHYFYARGATR